MHRRSAVWLLIPLLVVAGIGGVLIPRHGTAAPSLSGTLLKGTAAPVFHLYDQFGRSVRLADFRRRPVLLTFLYAHCHDTCPVIAEEVRRAVAELGAAGRKVGLVVISTDPEGDTPAVVRSFSRTHGLLNRWHYLTAPRQQLAPIWHAYHVYAAPLGADARLTGRHTTATYLIDGDGTQRVLFTGALDTVDVARDLRILMGLPVTVHLRDAAPAPEIGHPAPDFQLVSVHGQPIRLGSFRGRVVLVNVWATWCRPCRSEMPRLARWYRQYRSQGLVVLGVDKQEPRSDVQSFLTQLHIPYPVVLDTDASVFARYRVVAMPTSFLIDRQGTVQSVQIGVVDDAYLITRIQPLLRPGG